MSSYLKFNPTFKTNTSKYCQNTSRGNYIVIEGFDEEKKKELQDTIVKKLKQYKVNVVKLEDVIDESVSKAIVEIINDPALNVLNRASLMPVIAARTERWLDVKKYLDNGFWVISTGLDLAAIIDSKNKNVDLSKVLFFLDGSIKDEHTLSQLTIVIKSSIHACMEKHSYGWCDEIENSYENLASLCKAPLLSVSTMSTAVESAWQHIKQLL